MAQRDWLEKDFYKTLGVSSSASKDEIKKAYRKLAQQYHPDANKGDAAAEARFKEITEAHSVLSNDDKRKEYDELRRYGGGREGFGFRPGGGGRNVRVDIGDIGDLFGGGRGVDLGDLFGGFGFRGPRKGDDVEAETVLSFDQAVEGSTIELASGTKVRIPPGVTDGTRIRVSGKGMAGAGGERGDLYVTVRVRPHPLFSQGRNGDLVVEVPVTFPEAALGANVVVPTLDGNVTVKVPPGTQHGRTLRVRGKGGPRADGGTGDLHVRIAVEVPRKLSKKEREALERFAEVHDASPRAGLEREAARCASRAAS